MQCSFSSVTAECKQLLPHVHCQSRAKTHAPSLCAAGCVRRVLNIRAVARRCCIWLRVACIADAPAAKYVAAGLAMCALDRAEAHGPGVACEHCGAQEDLPWEDYPRAMVMKGALPRV